MQSREEAFFLLDWDEIEKDTGSDSGWHERFAMPLRIPEIFDRDFYPLYRRFLCACCRALEPLLAELESSQALDVFERFAFSRASFDEFVEARKAAMRAARRVRKRDGALSRAAAASEAVRDAARNDAVEALLLCCPKARRAGLTMREQAEVFQQTAAEWVAEGENFNR